MFFFPNTVQPHCLVYFLVYNWQYNEMKQLPLIGHWKFIWHVMDWLIIRWRPIFHNAQQPWMRCILRDLYSLSHLCIFHPAAGFPAPRLSFSHSSWSRRSGKHGCCSPSWRGNWRIKHVKCQFYVKHTHTHTHTHTHPHTHIRSA